MTAYVFPGQGSQFKGMGKDIFKLFPELVSQADEILGYSIEKLCLEDPDRVLRQTEFTQPALYTVSALSYLKQLQEDGQKPNFLAGHSLGEYVALFAAEVFDFQTGLRLVQKRGQLMSRATGGGMAAVLGMKKDQVKEVLWKNGLKSIDFANHNAETQIVLAGLQKDINEALQAFKEEDCRFIPLNVSAAFHSRYMKIAQEEFERFLTEFSFHPPTIPVISNVHARPYKTTQVKQNLVSQISHAVNWLDTIRFLMGAGEMNIIEIGPGTVLKKLTERITQESMPMPSSEQEGAVQKTTDLAPLLTAKGLGAAAFKKDHNVRYAYVAGGMYAGIASKNLVVRMGKAGLLSYFGTGALPHAEVDRAILEIQEELKENQPYGMNLIYNYANPIEEEKLVDLFLKHRVPRIEVSSYISVTPALVRYRLAGARLDTSGKVKPANRILVKLTRPEVARPFLSPPPEAVVEKLLEEGKISAIEAKLARLMPMVDDLCVEADSAGYTDRGSFITLLPALQQLAEQLQAKYQFAHPVRIGAGGGIGTPHAAAAAFMLGADFILTGSINQCTVEARQSDLVKDLLQQVQVQDMTYTHVGDMYDRATELQVLKKGNLFFSRADKLFEFYKKYPTWEDIEVKKRQQLEEKVFKMPYEEAYQKAEQLFSWYGPDELKKARQNPKFKMGLVFRWYFLVTMEYAQRGIVEQKANFQIRCGPAMGAFNQLLKTTPLEAWKNRHVDGIATFLMEGTAQLLQQRVEQWLPQKTDKPEREK